MLRSTALFVMLRPTVRFQFQTVVGNLSFGGSKNREVISQILSQLLGGPPGPRFFPPAVCANIIPLGNRPLCCRTTAPAKKSRCFWIVV